MFLRPRKTSAALPAAPGAAARSRLTRTTAVALAATLVLTACGGSGGDNDAAGDGGDVTIRFAWWGSDTRHRVTQEALDLFEEKNPGITVQADFTAWNGYFDRLNTSVAGGDAPDVITLEERYIAEYAENGVITDLEELDISLDGIDTDYVDLGRIDGTLYALPSGVNVHALVVDPQVVADSGVAMPDDTTWTWDEFSTFATDVAAASDPGVYGVQNYGFLDPALQIWLRQNGESLFTADGELGFSTENVAAWYQQILDLQQAGAIAPAATSEEIQAAGVEQSLVATNTGAMSAFWSNQLSALSNASGRELQLLRFPGETELDQPGMYLKAAMNYGVSSSSSPAKQAAAAKLVDFLVNDPEAGELILSDRGLPVNNDVLEAIQDDLEASDQAAATFLTEVRGDLVASPSVPPAGAGSMPDIMLRLASEVFFERITPQEAAERFEAELQTAVS